MSGHSKWATIHRAKEVKDAKKGVAFTKMAAAITIAVRAGGGTGDPEKNFRLRLVMEKARQANMPKENINRAIEKGTGAGGGAALEEVMYEGFLPGGAAVMVEVLTDNKLRTSQSVRVVLDKGGGSIAGGGAVSYMFDSLGEVVVDPGKTSMQDAELAAIDAGAVDVDEVDKRLLIYCEKDHTYSVKEKMETLGMKVESAELVMRPNTEIKIEKQETREHVEKILEQLDGLDDVTHVWSNYA